jgi:anti-sigma factor RsiW
MRCGKWALAISKWHEGELSAEGEADLLRHLENCSHCRSLEAKLRTVSVVLNDSPELPVPDYLSQRIIASVSEQMRQHSGIGVSGLFSFASYRFRALVAVGLLAIGLFVGSLAGHHLAGFAKAGPTTQSYDLLALGGIEDRSQSVAFSSIWQDNGEGGKNE